MTDRELMQQALDALELAKSMSDEGFVLSHTGVLAEPIEALRVRLAQPEPEPVATVYDSYDRREWQGLTEEERSYLAWQSNNGKHCVAMTEAMLREKNTS